MRAKPAILVVDDEEQVRTFLCRVLDPLGYEVATATDGADALGKVAASEPDLVVLDAVMPVLGGLETAPRLKKDEATRIIPIVMLTGVQDMDLRIQAFEAGVDDFIMKPFQTIELKARIASLLKVKEYNEQTRRYQKELEDEVSRRTSMLEREFSRHRSLSLETIYRLSRASEFRDEDTGAHLKRMSNFSAAVARKLGLGQRTVEMILYASAMHDVGKIGIPDQILLKPGRLSPREMEIMRMHPAIGAQILHGSSADFLRLGEVIALTHHERWDGTGYPHGLPGSKIPLAGCIASIADVFDALTTRRPYKEAIPVENALTIVRDGRESQFHPGVVDAFFGVIDEILAISRQYGDQEESELFRLTRLAESASTNKPPLD